MSIMCSPHMNNWYAKENLVILKNSFLNFFGVLFFVFIGVSLLVDL